MEPRREEEKALAPSAEQKPRRFRIIKLEERIAPGQAKTVNFCHYTHKCTGITTCYPCSGGRCW